MTPDLLLTSLRGGGQKAKQRNGTERNGTHPNDATHQQTDTPTDRQTNETNRKRRRRQEHNTEGKEGKEKEETTTSDGRKEAQKRSAEPPNWKRQDRAEADRIGRGSNLLDPVRCAACAKGLVAQGYAGNQQMKQGYTVSKPTASLHGH